MVQKIWRTKLKACKRAIRQKKDPLSTAEQVITERILEEDATVMYNVKNGLYLNVDHDQSEFPAIESFSSTMRTIIETRLTNIEQYAQKVIEFNNASSSS